MTGAKDHGPGLGKQLYCESARCKTSVPRLSDLGSRTKQTLRQFPQGSGRSGSSPREENNPGPACRGAAGPRTREPGWSCCRRRLLTPHPGANCAMIKRAPEVGALAARSQAVAGAEGRGHPGRGGGAANSWVTPPNKSPVSGESPQQLFPTCFSA